MENNIDEKFNQEMRDLSIKLKSLSEEIKRISLAASSCILSVKTREAFYEALIPFLEAESIMYQKGMALEMIDEDDEEEINEA